MFDTLLPYARHYLKLLDKVVPRQARFLAEEIATMKRDDTDFTVYERKQVDVVKKWGALCVLGGYFRWNHQKKIL